MKNTATIETPARVEAALSEGRAASIFQIVGESHASPQIQAAPRIPKLSLRQSRVRQRCDFALIRPGVRFHDEPRANGILPHEFPFLAVALVMAKQVIEKPFLRVRTPGCDGTRQAQSQDPNPCGEVELARAGNKEMRVVRHQNITTDDDLTCRSFVCELTETCVDRWRGEQRRAVVSVECHEPERRVVFLEDAVESRRAIGHRKMIVDFRPEQSSKNISESACRGGSLRNRCRLAQIVLDGGGTSFGQSRLYTLWAFAASCTAALLLSPLEAKEPSFQLPQPAAIPQRTFKVTDFGARGDGVAMSTNAFRAAIEHCAKTGGGRVIVPSGTFLTGPIELASRTALVLEKGAVIQASDRFADFGLPDPLPPTQSEIDALKKQLRPLISGTKLEDVAILGEGVIDGAGAAGWAKSDKAAE